MATAVGHAATSAPGTTARPPPPRVATATTAATTQMAQAMVKISWYSCSKAEVKRSRSSSASLALSMEPPKANRRQRGEAQEHADATSQHHQAAGESVLAALAAVEDGGRHRRDHE